MKTSPAFRLAELRVYAKGELRLFEPREGLIDLASLGGDVTEALTDERQMDQRCGLAGDMENFEASVPYGADL